MRMEYSNILREISEGIKNKEFAVFCGAGISVNSGLPVAYKLKQYILKKLTDDKKDKKDVKEIMNSKLPFEVFMEVLAENSDISKILNLFKEGEPNTNHIFIAKLAKARLIKTIITTNFDMMIETALKKEGLIRGKDKDFKVYYNEDQFSKIDFDALNKSNQINVFKLHGSIEDVGIEDIGSIRTTMKTIANRKLSEKRKKAINYLFAEGKYKNILILGYSCSDFFDINPQIQSIENPKNKIFFVDHTETTQIKDIKNQKLRNGNKNPFIKFSGYIIEHNTDDLVKEI